MGVIDKCSQQVGRSHLWPQCQFLIATAIETLSAPSGSPFLDPAWDHYRQVQVDRTQPLSGLSNCCILSAKIEAIKKAQENSFKEQNQRGLEIHKNYVYK